MNPPFITIVFVVMSGASLAAIGIRRIIKGELSVFGFKGFSDAAKINIDSTDRVLIYISGISFFVVLILVALGYY